MEPTLNISIPVSRGQLYLSALNALSLAGANLNDSAVILEEAQRVSAALKPKEAPKEEVLED